MDRQFLNILAGESSHHRFLFVCLFSSAFVLTPLICFPFNTFHSLPLAKLSFETLLSFLFFITTLFLSFKFQSCSFSYFPLFHFFAISFIRFFLSILASSLFSSRSFLLFTFLNLFRQCGATNYQKTSIYKVRHKCLTDSFLTSVDICKIVAYEFIISWQATVIHLRLRRSSTISLKKQPDPVRSDIPW